MKIRWTRWAGDQWLESLAYLEHENAAAAVRTEVSVLDAIALLAMHPHAGRIGKVPKTREFAVPQTSFVIGYQVDLPNYTLHILAVYDGRRRWPKAFPKK